MSLSNREGVDETGQRIARMEPFGKGEREKKIIVQPLSQKLAKSLGKCHCK